MHHGVVVKWPCARCKVTGEYIISDEIADKRSVRESKMVRNRFLRIPCNNKGSVQDGNEVSQEEEAVCDEELLKRICY